MFQLMSALGLSFEVAAYIVQLLQWGVTIATILTLFSFAFSGAALILAAAKELLKKSVSSAIIY